MNLLKSYNEDIFRKSLREEFASNMVSVSIFLTEVYDWVFRVV